MTTQGGMHALRSIGSYFLHPVQVVLLLLQRSCNYTVWFVLIYSVLYALSPTGCPMTINYANVLLTENYWNCYQGFCGFERKPGIGKKVMDDKVLQHAYVSPCKLCFTSISKWEIRQSRLILYHHKPHMAV